MFYYQDTRKLSKYGELQRKVVTKIREVTYINDSRNPKVAEPITTQGFEIVEEIVASPDFQCIPQVVGQKTVDKRNPDRVIKRSFTR